MQKFFLLFFSVFISISSVASQRSNKKTLYQDSTFHQRFISHILSEYELEGRWIFVRVDSVYKLPNNYELIHPFNIYEAYSEYSLEMEKDRFISMAYETLRQHELFERNPENKHPIKGIKVNMEIYNRLKSIPIKKLLRTYFNANGSFKSKYKTSLYEIIAVCYTNNIKVVTPKKDVAYYKLFK